jgi:hypothetical protein
MKTPSRRRVLGITIGVLATILVLDLATWAVHVQWRDAAIERLGIVTEQIETLAAQLAEDDDWIERNARLTQQYSQHDQFASRIEARGRRRTAHNALVDSYNEQARWLYRRFYLALTPTPQAPLRERWDP